MMFFGPKAESPPKNTFGTEDWNVSLSSFGRPFFEHDPGVLLDPRVGVFLAHRDEYVVALEELVRLAGRDQERWPLSS